MKKGPRCRQYRAEPVVPRTTRNPPAQGGTKGALHEERRETAPRVSDDLSFEAPRVKEPLRLPPQSSPTLASDEDYDVPMQRRLDQISGIRYADPGPRGQLMSISVAGRQTPVPASESPDMQQSEEPSSLTSRTEESLSADLQPTAPRTPATEKDPDVQSNQHQSSLGRPEFSSSEWQYQPRSTDRPLDHPPRTASRWDRIPPLGSVGLPWQQRLPPLDMAPLDEGSAASASAQEADDAFNRAFEDEWQDSTTALSRNWNLLSRFERWALAMPIKPAPRNSLEEPQSSYPTPTDGTDLA